MKKIVSIILSLMVLTCQTAFADSLYLKFSGKTDTEAKGATILVLKNGIDEDNVKPSDVIYIDQVSVSADGSFSITIPFFLEDDYTIKSNALESDLNEVVKNKVVYISENGSDSNTGLSSDVPWKTLAKAYSDMAEIKEIKIIGSVAYTEPVTSYAGELKISGVDASSILTVPSEISLKGDLTLSNINLSGLTTIYANGKHLRIEETVTTTNALTAFGAKKSATLDGDTNIEILGGRWSRIYGGGSAAVNGNTNLVVGGKVNEGCGINDQEASTFSDCIIFGGGNNASVSGKTNVHLTGNAVVAYTIGAGYNANGTASETNILIDEKSKCMNVYGGSYNSPISTTTNVTLKGNALVEGIFGGSQRASLTGHTNVNLLGGEVQRRVYSGCYNDTSNLSSNTDYVTGTTTLRIGKAVKLNTKNGLDAANEDDIGVRAGSRMSSSKTDEKNTLIYLENSYSTQNGKIGSQDWKSGLLSLSSRENLTVKAGENGDIRGTGTHGVIKVIPNDGYYGVIGNTTYPNETNVTISETTTVTFNAKNFYVNVNNINTSDTGVATNIDVTANNITGELTPRLIVVLYDDSNELVDFLIVDAASETGKTVNFNCTLDLNKTYTLKATIWDGDMTPLTTVSAISFTK